MSKAKKTKAKTKFVPMKIELTFKEDDIQAILNSAHFGDSPCPLRADKLTPAQYKELHEELRATAGNFVWEIVDGSDEACASDWLDEFARKHMGRGGDDE